MKPRSTPKSHGNVSTKNDEKPQQLGQSRRISLWRTYCLIVTIIFVFFNVIHMSTLPLPYTSISTNDRKPRNGDNKKMIHQNDRDKNGKIQLNSHDSAKKPSRLTNDKKPRIDSDNKNIHKNNLDNNKKIKKQKYHDDGTKPFHCKLRKSPQPVIIISIGRSGSSSTWQIMSRLSGEEILSDEYTGSSEEGSKAFFEKLTQQNNTNWILETMCKRQKQHPNVGMVGFKWKPYTGCENTNSINCNKDYYSTMAKHGLQYVASAREPGIKVVRLRRNLLDVIISRQKHEGKVSAHCAKNDKKCIQQHLKEGTGIELNIDKLLVDLENVTKQEDVVDEILVKLGVPTVHISYEKAYYGTNAKEWIQVCDFLGICTNKKELTMTDIHAITRYASTSSPYHNVTLKNYVAVKEVLHDTKFESLLH